MASAVGEHVTGQHFGEATTGQGGSGAYCVDEHHAEARRRLACERWEPHADFVATSPRQRREAPPRCRRQAAYPTAQDQGRH